MDLDNIRHMQESHKEWLDRNFPGQEDHDGALGVIEEAGELAEAVLITLLTTSIGRLAHAQLKGQQGIRHTPEEIIAMKKDALGDIFIFMLSYGNTNDFDIASCIEDTWNEIVSRRDWVADPVGGAT